MLNDATSGQSPQECAGSAADSLTAEYLEWWERENDARQSETIRFDGLEFFVDRRVFSPAVRMTYATCFMSRFLHDAAGKRVLDQGTGCGVLAILAARRGARHVVAVDIDRAAVDNALKNVRRFRLTRKVHVAQGDVFGPPAELFGNGGLEEKIDVVIANLPIASGVKAWRRLGGDFEENLLRWAHNLKEYLVDGGVAYMSWASFGDPALPDKAFSAANLSVREFSERTFGVTWRIFEVRLPG